MIYIVSYTRYGQRFELRFATRQEAREKQTALARRRIFTTLAERKVLTYAKNWSRL